MSDLLLLSNAQIHCLKCLWYLQHVGCVERLRQSHELAAPKMRRCSISAPKLSRVSSYRR